MSTSDPNFRLLLANLYKYIATRLNINETPRVVLIHNSENAKEPFGLTGGYDGENKVINIYVTNRVINDILRSFAHECVHHWQNERGTLSSTDSFNKTYAQNDINLRKRELEAYMFGGILYRDWQD